MTRFHQLHLDGAEYLPGVFRVQGTFVKDLPQSARAELHLDEQHLLPWRWLGFWPPAMPPCISTSTINIGNPVSLHMVQR